MLLCSHRGESCSCGQRGRTEQLSSLNWHNTLKVKRAPLCSRRGRSAAGEDALQPERALCSRRGRSAAGEGALQPERMLCSRRGRSAAGEGTLQPERMLCSRRGRSAAGEDALQPERTLCSRRGRSAAGEGAPSRCDQSLSVPHIRLLMKVRLRGPKRKDSGQVLGDEGRLTLPTHSRL